MLRKKIRPKKLKIRRHGAWPYIGLVPVPGPWKTHLWPRSIANARPLNKHSSSSSVMHSGWKGGSSRSTGDGDRCFFPVTCWWSSSFGFPRHRALALGLDTHLIELSKLLEDAVKIGVVRESKFSPQQPHLPRIRPEHLLYHNQQFVAIRDAIRSNTGAADVVDTAVCPCWAVALPQRRQSAAKEVCNHHGRSKSLVTQLLDPVRDWTQVGILGKGALLVIS